VVSGTTSHLKKFFAALMLAIFAAYFVSTNMFYHSHVVLGDTIVHSHPFKSDSNGKPIHSHNDKGYLTIQYLSCLLLSVIIFTLIRDGISLNSSELVVKLKLNKVLSSSRLVYSLRAPPENML
jgi:hypothetical protein